MKYFSLIKRLAFLVILGWYHTGFAQSDTLSLFTGLNEYKAPYYEMTKPNIIRISLFDVSFGFTGIMRVPTNSLNSQGEIQEEEYSITQFTYSLGFEYERALNTLLGIGLSAKGFVYYALGSSLDNPLSTFTFAIGPKVGGFLTKYFELGRSKTKLFISPYVNAGFSTDPVSRTGNVLFYLDLGAVLGIDFVMVRRGSIGLDIGYKFVGGFHFFSIGSAFHIFQIHF